MRAENAGRTFAKTSEERIDGIVALIMALERATSGDGVYWSPENGVSF